MSGNKTLYTTVKCRSMTTKEEFVEMWNKTEQKIKEVMIGNDSGILATSYEFMLNSPNESFIKILLDNHFVGIVYLGDVVKVE